MVVDGFNQYAPHAAVDAGDGDFNALMRFPLVIIVQFGLLLFGLEGFDGFWMASPSARTRTSFSK